MPNRPVPKYKKPAAQLTKPVREQPDYAYLFKGYDADALVLTDQQINSLGQAVDGNEQHPAEPTSLSSPLYGETDSDDSDPFIYDHVPTILPSSAYYDTFDEDDNYNASDEGDSLSDNNSFEYGSAFDSDYDDDTFEVHDTNNDDDDDDNDPSDSNDDDDDEGEGEEDQHEEAEENDYYNPEDYFTDTNNFNYYDDNESGDSSSRCSNLDSHPLHLPPPIYAIAPHLTYQSPPTAPTMLPPVPHNTPLTLLSNAPSTIPHNNPRYSDLGTLEILNPHIRNMIYGFVLADSPTISSEEVAGVDSHFDVGVQNSTTDRNNMLLVCWAMREEVLDFLARPFSSSGDESE